MTDIVSHIRDRMEHFYKKEGRWPQYIILNHYTRLKLLNYFFIENYTFYKDTPEREEKLNGTEMLLRPSDYNEEIYIKLV